MRVELRFERAVRCVLALQAGASITSRWLREQFDLSPAQAKRDLNELERLLPVKRERGVLTLRASQSVKT